MLTGNLFKSSGRNATPADTNGQKPAQTIERGDRFTNHLLDLPKRVGYGVERIKLTPELAQHYLTFNRVNRDVITGRVDGYADEMSRGEWVENGESIKFSKSQKMVDGQHRCLAVVKSGVAIHVLVVYGVEDEVAPKIDIGKVRTASDVLSLQGLGRWESRIAGTAAHTLINYKQGLPLSSNVKRLNREIEAFYLEFQSPFTNSIKFISELPRKNTPIQHTKALVLHYLFAQKDVATADSFMERLFVGDSLTKTSPIYQLRQKLIEAHMAGTAHNTREQYHGCIKAWNYVRGHKTLSSSRSLFPRSDEPLPEIE